MVEMWDISGHHVRYGREGPSSSSSTKPNQTHGEEKVGQVP